MGLHPGEDVTDIDVQEALQLIEQGAVQVLDVRTPQEYEKLGHIPGATLLPVDLCASGAATLAPGDPDEPDAKPWLVVCEHGVRSAHAAGLLARAGFAGVRNMVGGMSVWPGPRDHTAGDPFGASGPSSWLVENARLLPRDGRILDLACGRGRHALLLAAAEFEVQAVDNDPAIIENLTAVAERLGLSLQAQVLDLESEDVKLPEAGYGAILGFHYLHRPLFPALIEALRPGGVLLYETFNVRQRELGHPTNPRFLLESQELLQLVEPLEVLKQREGSFHGRMVSAVAARK
jgi:rhodanese-related sulfurtransferase